MGNEIYCCTQAFGFKGAFEDNKIDEMLHVDKEKIRRTSSQSLSFDDTSAYETIDSSDDNEKRVIEPITIFTRQTTKGIDIPTTPLSPYSDGDEVGFEIFDGAPSKQNSL
mmetsp:Transcript_9856/g.14992  ORF Transcript_9856/g.14992 Transcript_9856/m.14992 type:complete len:110 (+) Transcript_9856:41-370(+)|eukprot:CAMPEP_0202705102 /NCGR_PEP_ID=MMETSP1385-20130828/17696_1 /ASSEMBLY_ACC=CAM_ASM_000861 /TAXON_ID=933848 /ORGANISM="Elphidium margaritaceum" /LENGTH=109 /DNA_ID=CAMNT_0049363263 /DNA_START=37 /DNA_END=366 /DNA_ORIENTATION=-